jgi:hypothetical protein
MFPVQRAASTIEEITVWGGCVANCAESSLSRLVDKHAATLRQVTYIPERTKGGVLVRPKYHRGDREGNQNFPLLESLEIRLSPSIQPFEYGWNTPALRELTLSIDLASQRSPPSAASLARVLDVRDPGHGYARHLHEHCPSVEAVHVVVCRADDTRRSRLRLCSVRPPSEPVPWEVFRLLLLLTHKPDEAVADEATERCHNALRQAAPLLLPLVQPRPWRVCYEPLPHAADPIWDALQLSGEAAAATAGDRLYGDELAAAPAAAGTHPRAAAAAKLVAWLEAAAKP